MPFSKNHQKISRLQLCELGQGPCRTRQHGGKSFPSFTLIELLVAMGIFTVVGTIALSLFGSLTQSRRRIELETMVQSESRILLERLERDIRRNMIDYGEYYNRLVLHGTNFGDNLTAYASRFFNLGSDDSLGARCNDAAQTIVSAGCPSGSVINTRTIDSDTGQNPAVATSVSPDDASAFCDNTSVDVHCTGRTWPTDFIQHQLYVIDQTGHHKEIIGLKNLGRPTGATQNEFALALIRLTAGPDTTGDGVPDSWICDSEFSCPTPASIASNFVPTNADLGSDDFNTSRDTSTIRDYARPITPLNLSVSDVQFEIIPQEDPLRAWSEDAMQINPSVRVRITVRPSASVSQGITITPITLQTVVMPELHRRIPMGEVTGG